MPRGHPPAPPAKRWPDPGSVSPSWHPPLVPERAKPGFGAPSSPAAPLDASMRTESLLVNRRLYPSRGPFRDRFRTACASPSRKARSPAHFCRMASGLAARAANWDSITVLICQISTPNARLGRANPAFSLPIVAAKDSWTQQEEHGCDVERNGVAHGVAFPGSAAHHFMLRRARTRGERRMHFASDNAAGIAPAILAAIGRANDGFALGYGEDAITKRLERRLAEIFEHELAAFLVPTGTAANALALSQIAPPWGAVLCHEECHLATDECGAPEFFGGGLKLIALAGEACKIPAATLEAALKRLPWGGPHHVTAAALSLTQATEAGTLYAPDEMRRLAELA